MHDERLKLQVVIGFCTSSQSERGTRKNHSFHSISVYSFIGCFRVLQGRPQLLFDLVYEIVGRNILELQLTLGVNLRIFRISITHGMCMCCIRKSLMSVCLRSQTLQISRYFHSVVLLYYFYESITLTSSALYYQRFLSVSLVC